MTYNKSFTYNNIAQSAPPDYPLYVTNKYYGGLCNFYNVNTECNTELDCHTIEREFDGYKLEPIIVQYNKTDDNQLNHEKYWPNFGEFKTDYFYTSLHKEKKTKQFCENKTTNCPWFEHGYCKFGRRCKYIHDKNINPSYFNQLYLNQINDKFNFSKVCKERFLTSVPKIKVCSYCKKPGHKASRCRQKKRNNNRLCRRCKCFEKIESTYKY